MKIRKTAMALLTALAAGFVGAVLSASFPLTVCGQTEHASQTSQVPQAPPPMFHKMELSGICGNQDYLYVMAGAKIMVYKIGDMALLNTVELPDPPAAASPPKPDSSKLPPPFPPPHGGGPQGLWAGDRVLFVMAGPVIYKYSTPDLTLISSKELPKPELPKQGN